MEIKSKYDIGQVVYKIDNIQEDVEEKCNFCGGTGKVKVNGTTREVDCPDCDGLGEVYVGVSDRWSVVHESKIYEITVSEGNKITYELDYCDSAPEENLFPTLEEAVKRCKELNGDE